MKKITVVGGGNAGCFTALYCAWMDKQKDFEVELIYDPEISPERVGQATILEASALLWATTGFNWYDNKIHATMKSGILYENWGNTDKLFHPFQPFIIGQKCFAPKMAIKFNIPLIFYGEQEAEYGTPVNESMSSKRDWTYSSTNERDNMFFGGVSYASLKKDFGLTDNDLSIYTPEKIDNINKQAIDFRYLGYYLKWHPQSCYYLSLIHI